MVLEQLYSVEWLEKRPIFALLIGMAYTVIGITLALLLFPEDPALVAVAFISVLLLPTLYKMMALKEIAIRKHDKFSFKVLLKEHGNFVKIYILLFLGILFVFSFFSIMLPNLAANQLFREQVEILQYNSNVGNAITGKAYWHGGLLKELFLNNIKVLIFCFVISLLTGNGAIFLITWNASVWGTIFGNVAKTAAFQMGKNPFAYFLLIMVSVLPHAVLEALGYVLAAISGGIISKTILVEKAFSNKMSDVLIVNLILLVIGVIILIVGAFVETYVLLNFETYRIIITQAFA